MLGMIDNVLFKTVQVVKAALKIAAPHLTGAAGAAGAISAPTGQATMQVAAWRDAHSPFCHDDCWYTGFVTQFYVWQGAQIDRGHAMPVNHKLIMLAVPGACLAGDCCCHSITAIIVVHLLTAMSVMPSVLKRLLAAE
jgi:hypothetical protein